MRSRWTTFRIKRNSRRTALRLYYRFWTGMKIYNRFTDLALRAKTPAASMILYGVADWAKENLV
jgi:hypothetical protein